MSTACFSMTIFYLFSDCFSTVLPAPTHRRVRAPAPKLPVPHSTANCWLIGADAPAGTECKRATSTDCDSTANIPSAHERWPDLAEQDRGGGACWRPAGGLGKSKRQVKSARFQKRQPTLLCERSFVVPKDFRRGSIKLDKAALSQKVS